MKFVSAVLAATTTLATPAWSEEANVRGIGYMQCPQLTEMYRKAPPGVGIQMLDGLVGSWASGFMSATNMAMAVGNVDTKNLASSTIEQQIISIRRFCKQHPDKQVMDAVVELYQGLSSNVDAN